MNEAIPFVVAAGVVILVLFEGLKWVKAHQSNPQVQALESKLPPSVQSALELPPAAPAILTGDHLVQVVQAQGAAMAQVAQAVATAPPAPSPFAGYGVGAFSTGATTYNPDNYTQDTRYPAYLAAGRPVKDALGRALGTDGSLIDNAPSVATNDPTQGMWGGDCGKGQTLHSAPFIGDGSTRVSLMNDPGNALGVTYTLTGAGNGLVLTNNLHVSLVQGLSYGVDVTYDGSNPHHPDVARTGIWLRK